MFSNKRYSEYVYSGICTNEKCTNRLQFVCKPCYDFASNTSNGYKIRFGGRKIGIHSTIKIAKSHVRKTTIHNNAIKWFKDQKKNDDI
jgi:hypothetical protein